MKNTANTLSKIAILGGIVSLILALVAHWGPEIVNVGYWGFGMGAIALFLLAIALNSVALTEEE